MQSWTDPPLSFTEPLLAPMLVLLSGCYILPPASPLVALGPGRGCPTLTPSDLGSAGYTTRPAGEGLAAPAKMRANWRPGWIRRAAGQVQ